MDVCACEMLKTVFKLGKSSGEKRSIQGVFNFFNRVFNNVECRKTVYDVYNGLYAKPGGAGAGLHFLYKIYPWGTPLGAGRKKRKIFVFFV